ncbi:MAG: DNA-directed RNA polymerase subunit alpha [Patescibacteria group bacterium]
MQDLHFTVKEVTASPDFGEFVLEPLESGYGHTLGNAIRRVLYGSIPGSAVTSVKIAGVKHKFSTLQGLKENIIDLLLNIKELNFKLADGKESVIVKVSVKGTKEITAADLQLPDGVEILNKDHYIGSLSGEKSKFEMELVVEKGYGYSLAEERKGEELGSMTTDAVFTPVRRVTYTISSTRVGRRTDLDKLVLKIWTNGTVSPRESLNQAAKILTNSFRQIYEPSAVETTDEVPAATASISQAVLQMTIDELDLPTRIYNSLRNGGIENIEQLLATPRKELISMRNMGGKSISIIEEKLQEKGVSLNI